MHKLTLVLIAALALAAAAPGVASASPLPPIKHVFIIVLENENQGSSFGSGSKAPYLARTLTSEGAYLPNYYGIGHFSNDNYIAMISGQAPNPDNQADCQFYSDLMPGGTGSNGQAVGVGCVFPSWVQTVANQLNSVGLTWKGYMEDMGNDPARESKTCGHPALNSQDKTQSAQKGDQYATRHDPFVYFHSIIDSPICQQDVVPLTQLSTDLRKASTTPTYSFITPNLCDDGHDSPCVDGRPGGLVSANAFLQQWVPRITRSAAYDDGGMLIVTFDEAASGGQSCCGEQPGPNSPYPGGTDRGPGGGKVGAVILSPYTKPGTVDQTAYNHYALLRSVEDMFELGHLGFAAANGLKPFGADVFNRPAKRLPQINIAGIPRACVARAFTLRVSVKGGRVKRIIVSLDRHRIAKTRHARLRVRIPAKRLHHGNNTLVVTAVAASGTARATRTVRRCSGSAHPSFTG